MGTFMVQTANTIWRDFVTDGVPSSTKNRPKKSEIRAWGTWIEGIITAFTANGGLIYSSKAAMDADLAHAANTMAWVVGDATVANNGVYQKQGASGAGSWTRVADLPFSFTIASDAGAGTPNAIQATTNIPVSGSALIWMNIFEANTASPVTVSFNGGAALTIKTNSGNDITVGGLNAGMIVLGIVSGTTFRLVSDQASAAVLAACEAAKTAAQAAQAAAEAAAAGVTLPPAVANTYLRQKADASGYETKTSAQVVADLNSVPVQIAGGDSAARDAVARFGDTIDIREFGFILTGAAGTEATNNAAIDRLIAHATANPGMVYRARKGDVIRFNGNSKTIPKSRLRLEGALIQWTGNLSASAAVAMTMGDGTDVDCLRLQVPAGGLFRRLVDFSGNNRLSEGSLECENQINNEGGSNLDRAIRFFGHNNDIGEVRVKNADNCVVIWGNGGAGNPQRNSTYRGFVFENFCKGGLARNLTNCTILPGRAFGKSPNGLPDPGYNAWLFEGLVGCVIGPRELFDSWEHNERWGGPHSGEQLTRDCIVGPLLSGRAGQSGFKIWSGLNTDVIYGMTFGPMNIFDCGIYAQAGNTAPPQFNDFGVMVQAIARSTFSTINIYAKDATYSSLDGGYFSQCTDVMVALVNSHKAKRNGLRISEYNGNATDSNATNTLRFGQVNVATHEAEGIYVQVPTSSMRDLSIDDFNIVGGTDAVRCEGAIARFAQPCYFRGGARGFSGTKFNVPVGTNVKTVDKFA